MGKMKVDRLNEPERPPRIRLLTAAFLILAAAGCLEEDERNNINLVITGSTTVLPAVERCAEVFNRAQDDIRVQVSSGGSGRGIQDVATGLADIGMASREVKDSEVRIFGDLFVEHLIGYDAIAGAAAWIWVTQAAAASPPRRSPGFTPERSPDGARSAAPTS
jgi:phosphate transport system substrate-binding protein